MNDCPASPSDLMPAGTNNSFNGVERMITNCVICNDVIFIHTMAQKPIFQGPFCCGPECLQEAEEERELRLERSKEVKELLGLSEIDESRK